jgi:hypothetical protein
MNKFSLRWIVFPILLIVVSGAVLQSHVRARSMAGSAATHTDPHMSMTKLRPLQPGDQARADAIVAAAKKAAERYGDYRKAQADGYAIFMPEQHQNVYHFILQSSGAEDRKRFDPDQPPGLLYTKIDGPGPRYKLVGVMYMVRFSATEEELNARIPLSIAQWHVHRNLCAPQQAEKRNWLMGDPDFGLNGSIATEEACRAAGGYFKPHLGGWMTHVYPFETNPAKVWSAGMGDDHGVKGKSMPSMKMSMRCAPDCPW